MKNSAPTNTCDELRDLLCRIRDDPDASAWAEWARRLIEGDASLRRDASNSAVTSEDAETNGVTSQSKRRR